MATDETTEINKFWNAVTPLGTFNQIKLWSECYEIIHDAIEFLDVENAEDSLTTKYKEANADQFDKIQGKVKSVLTAGGVSPVNAGKLASLFTDKSYRHTIIGPLLRTLAALISPLSVTLATLNASKEKYARLVMADVQPRLPEIGALIQAHFHNIKDETTAKLMAEHGLGFDEWNRQLEGSRPVFTLEQILHLRQREGWSTEATDESLKRLGWTLDRSTGKTVDGPSLDWLLRARPPVEELQELRRRKIIEPETFDKELRFWGYDENTRLNYDLLKTRLTPLNVLAEYHRRNLMADKDILEAIDLHGYPETDRQKLWDLQYIPVSLMESRDAYWRGKISKDDFLNRLRRLGYREDDAYIVESISWLLPTPQDLIRFGVREVYTPRIRKQYRMDEDFPKQLADEGKKIGLQEKTLKQYWAAHWDLPSPGQGFDMFHRGIIDLPQLKTLLRALDVNPFWRDKMIQIAYRLIPRRTLPRLARYNLVSETQLADRFVRLGYSPKDAGLLAKEAVIRAQESRVNLTKAEIGDAYIYGFISKQVRDESYNKLFIDGLEKTYLQRKTEYKKERYELAEQARVEREEAKDARQLTKGEILRGVKAMTVPANKARELLDDLGYSKETRNYLVNFAIYQRLQENKQVFARELEKQFMVGAIGARAAEAKLVNRGYSQQAARQLITLWELKLETEKILEAAKERHPTKADVEKWLVSGIITTEEWQDYMEELGYNDVDTRHYLEMLIIEQEGE